MSDLFEAKIRMDSSCILGKLTFCFPLQLLLEWQKSGRLVGGRCGRLHSEHRLSGREFDLPTGRGRWQIAAAAPTQRRPDRPLDAPRARTESLLVHLQTAGVRLAALFGSNLSGHHRCIGGLSDFHFD